DLRAKEGRGAVRLQLPAVRPGGESLRQRQPFVDPDARHVPRDLPPPGPGDAQGAGRRGMKLADFDFDLPEALIATRPARPRTSARLLLAEGDSIRDLHVRDLVDVFRPGDLLVLNNTRVIPARLFGTRTRGEAVAKVEVTLLEPAAGGGWRALAKPLRKVREGEVIAFSGRLSATVAEK